MKHGSLFSGIGGFDLAAEWIGWDNIFHCEIEEFPKKVLKYYWPNAISYGDITKTDFTIHRGQIDILTGGFPCQPFSLAGKRKGTEDHRNLWPEMLRAIQEIQPVWIVGENVPGLINWSGGLVFEQVQIDLENEGYEVTPYILPACSQNAPHKRERVWFIAYSDMYGHKSRRFSKDRFTKGKGESKKTKWEWVWNDSRGISKQGITPDTCRKGHERSQRVESLQRRRKKSHGTITECFEISTWDNWPTQPPICSRDDGFSSELDGITFSKWRNESIKAYGNAIVPQVVYQIFKVIDQLNNQL
jgi:DNA (cytosine-5)-methyltransferase 1